MSVAAAAFIAAAAIGANWALSTSSTPAAAQRPHTTAKQAVAATNSTNPAVPNSTVCNVLASIAGNYLTEISWTGGPLYAECVASDPTGNELTLFFDFNPTAYGDDLSNFTASEQEFKSLEAPRFCSETPAPTFNFNSVARGKSYVDAAEICGLQSIDGTGQDMIFSIDGYFGWLTSAVKHPLTDKNKLSLLPNPTDSSPNGNPMKVMLNGITSSLGSYLNTAASAPPQ